MIKNLFTKEKELLHTTDLHSHLIPNIDDGYTRLKQSIDAILQLKKLGFKKIITTPHIMPHRFPNTKEIILKNYKILQNELIKQNIDINLKVAAEYYYDNVFFDLIEKKELLTFGKNYILFEFSFHTKPFGLELSISKLLENGYKPVLAHPERYSFFNNIDDYITLKEMGVFFQINAISIQGFYGKKVQKKVENIIDYGLVDFIGSDIHSQSYIDSFTKSLQSKIYSKLFINNHIKNDYL